jgi:hypothetical protein
MKKDLFIVSIIFFCICIIRIFMALSVDGFSSDSSYYTLRQVEHISKTGLPIIHDDLSYLGRTYYFLPAFYYFLAFFDIFLPIEIVCKIIPNIVAALGVFIVYLIGFEVTKNKEAALFTSFISGIVPVFLSETVYSVSVYSFVVPLFLALIYTLIKISKLNPVFDLKKMKFYKFLYFILFILLSLLHQSIVLFVLFLWLYLFILVVEGIKISKSEIEITIFSSFLVLWIFFITLKPIFIEHGFSIIFGGIPHFMRNYYFSNFTLLESIYKLGIIPVLYGLYSLFRFTFGKQDKYVYMLVSQIYLMLFLLWFKIIPFNSGMIFLGTFLMIIVILHYDFLFGFFNFSNKSTFKKIVKFGFISYYVFSFVVSSVLPSVTYLGLEKQKIPTDNEIRMFKFMKDNIKNESVIFAIPDYGQKIAYFSSKKTIMDTNYFGTDEANRLIDIEKAYTSSSLLLSGLVFQKYGAEYIIISDKTKKEFNSSFPSYINSKCFDLIRQENDVFLFKFKCEVETFEK